MSRKRVTAPILQPISVQEAKAQARIESADEDALLSLYLAAAVEDVEEFLGRALVDQTWDLFLDAFPASRGAIQIPLPPLLAVTGVYYTDADGVEQEFSTFGVDTASEPGRVYLSPGVEWPTPRVSANAVRVRFRAGYMDTSTSPYTGDIPDSIRAAVILMAAARFAEREKVDAMLSAAFQLLRFKRVELGMA